MSSSPSTWASSPKPGHSVRQAESATTQSAPVKNDQSGKEPEDNENTAGGSEGEGSMDEAEKPEDGNHETDSMSRQSPTPNAEEERRQGGNEEYCDQQDEERRQPTQWRPQRRGTLPSTGWQDGPVDNACFDHNVEQSEGEKENGENPHPLTAEGGAAVVEEKRHSSGPRRPQRHGTLPEGSDWEETLRREYGAAASAAVPVAAAAAQSACGEGSEGTSWSVAEEANSRSNPTNGSHSPTRSFHSPNARRSRLVLTPDGSDSSVWSRGHTDGVESIQRWLHVRIRLLIVLGVLLPVFSSLEVKLLYQR